MILGLLCLGVVMVPSVKGYNIEPFLSKTHWVNTSLEWSVPLRPISRPHRDYEFTLSFESATQSEEPGGPWIHVVLMLEYRSITLGMHANRTSASTLLCFPFRPEVGGANEDQEIVFVFASAQFPVQVTLEVREVHLLLDPGSHDVTLEQDHPLSFFVVQAPDHPGYTLHLEYWDDFLHQRDAPCVLVTLNSGSCSDDQGSYWPPYKRFTLIGGGTIPIRPAERQKTWTVSLTITSQEFCLLSEKTPPKFDQVVEITLNLQELQPYTSYVLPLGTLTLATLLVSAFGAFVVWCKRDQSPEVSDSTDDNDSPPRSDQVNLQTSLSSRFESSAYKSQALARLNANPSVSHFVHGIERDKWMKRNRSKVYLLMTPLISLFYFVPSIQFVVLAKQVEEVSGSMDHCYHNFYCAKPWYIFDDFNHIASNLSYIVYGSVFMAVVFYQGLRRDPNQSGGVPQQSSIFYAIGMTMIAEGAFSLTYHVCPTNFSLQFDTTMLYILGFLAILKLYQFRHPDAVMTGYTFFGIMSGIVILAALSLYITNWIFFGLFLACYLLATLALVMDAYYMGILKIDKCAPSHLVMVRFQHISQRGTREVCGVSHIENFFVCTVFFVLNVAIASLALVRKFEHSDESLTNVFLAIIGVNVFSYLGYYLIRRFIERCELGRSSLRSWITHGPLFIALALVFACLAYHFFKDEHKSRWLTPAQSRALNEPCVFLNFFDNHDIWHFFSASALFMTFLCLLVIDDDLQGVPRDQIPVF